MTVPDDYELIGWLSQKAEEFRAEGDDQAVAECHEEINDLLDQNIGK
jgi:hypothetical protein